MKIAFIGFPLALGADRKGVELAPDYFRKEGTISWCSRGSADIPQDRLPLQCQKAAVPSDLQLFPN